METILKNPLIKFCLWCFGILLVCFIGVSNVFADEILDTSTWINVTGRNWSISGQEYYTGTQTFNSNWLLNRYNITGGLYIPPTDIDYITFSFFQHSGSIYNPCNNAKYTSEFRLLLEDKSFLQYIDNVKWAGKTCNIVKDTSNGVISVSCIPEPTNSNLTSITIYLSEISGTNATNIYISRNIDISCSIDTESIINNATENTQNIINNQYQNTQDIINNQNSIAQQQQEQQQVCEYIDKNNIEIDNKFLKDNGTYQDDTSWGITEYIQISDKSIIKLITQTFGGSPNYCFYDINQSLLSCYRNSTLDNITIPQKSSYVRFSIFKPSNLPQFEICKNGNQAMQDTLTNDNVDSSSWANFFNNFTTNTFGLTSIITAPLNLIQSLTSTSCTDLQLPLPYLQNKYLTLPCMSSIYSQYFGTFFTLYQTITYGIIAYWVCVRIFNLVKDFKNPDHDEIEVVDL